MEVVQGVQNGYTVLNLEMNKVQQCNSCILNTLHHGIIMMSDNNGIPDNNGKIKDNNKKIPWGRGWKKHYRVSAATPRLGHIHDHAITPRPSQQTLHGSVRTLHTNNIHTQTNITYQLKPTKARRDHPYMCSV